MVLVLFFGVALLVATGFGYWLHDLLDDRFDSRDPWYPSRRY